MDIQDKFQNIKNKLLRHSFTQERDDQQQISQLQSDINSGGNDENHVQQIITLEGDQEFTIQNVPVENPVSLTKRLSQKFISPPQDNNNALAELSTPLNQQNMEEQQEQNKGGLDNFLKTFQKYDFNQTQQQQRNQIVNDIERQEEQKENNQIQEFSTHDQSPNTQNLALFLQNLNMENNPQINRLLLVSKFQTDMLEHLQKLTQQEYDNNLNELNGPFWQNLQLKLKHYQKLIIFQFLMQALFLLLTAFYSFRQFSIEMLGAKLILMYLAKNVGELYLINQQMNILSQKIDDYESLKYKLSEQQKSFQIHIDNIKTNQNLLQQQIQSHNSRDPMFLVSQILQMCGMPHMEQRHNALQSQQQIDQLITQTISSMGDLMNFLQQIKDDEYFKRKQLDIALLKESVFSFQKNFQPYEEFITQPQKQSTNRIKQAVVRESQKVLFLTYLIKMVVIGLTMLNCMILFTDSSQKISTTFFYILWVNLISDHLQIFALGFFIILLIGFFIAYFIFTRTVMLVKRVKHNQKLKQRLSSLKKSKYVKNDDPNATKECSICLSEYENDETVITLSCDTKHVFHQECIETWVKQKDECPLCRAIIFN